MLVSDAQRTLQTWDSVATKMPGFDGQVSIHEEIYTGGAAEVLALVHGVDAHLPVVLVVGHEPTISTLASALAGDESDASAIAQARIRHAHRQRGGALRKSQQLAGPAGGVADPPHHRPPLTGRSRPG